MPESKQFKRNKLIIKILLGVIFTAALANCFYLLSIPSDEKNILFLNYSLNRLVLAGFLICGAILAALGWMRINQFGVETIEKIAALFGRRWFISFLVFLFVLTLLFLWMSFMAPPYILQKTQPIVERLRPIGLWLLVVSFACSILAGLFNRGNAQPAEEASGLHKGYLVSAAIVFSFFACAVFVFPKITDDLSFGRYSVPLLITQSMFSWAIIILGLQVWRAMKPKHFGFLTRRIDLIIFIALWVSAAWLWVRQPITFMEGKFFTTIHQHMRALPPNYDIYPSRDSQAYYLISESIVIGKGIYRSLDKSLFLAMQGLNNWLSSGSFERMLNTQTLMLGVFPAIIYLIAKDLHSRAAGLMSSVLVLLLEYNGLKVMDELPLTSMKVLLSEPFVQVFCAVIVLLAVKAFKHNQINNRNDSLFLACGGALGLSAMIRLNTFVVAPLIVLIILVGNIKKPRTWIRRSVFFLIGILIALTPLMIHHADRYDNPLAFMKGKVQNLIIDNRYKKIIKRSFIEIEPARTPGETLSFYRNEDPYLETSHLNDVGADHSFMFLSGNIVPCSAQLNNILRITNELCQDFFYGIRNSADEALNKYTKVVKVIAQHFFNNVISSFAVLPTNLHPQNLYHAIRGQLFWGTFDEANYLPVSGWMIVVNLIILIIGIGSALKNNRQVGSVPLIVFTGYHLSSAMAVTSGNRYSQPVSWVVILYYGLGLITIGNALLKYINGGWDTKIISPDKQDNFKPPNLLSFGLIMLLILTIGSAPVMADRLPHKRYATINKNEIISAILNHSTCLDSDQQRLLTQEMKNLQPKNISASIGRALQPIIYDQETFLAVNGSQAAVESNRFLTFQFIGPQSRTPFRLFYETTYDIPELTHRTDLVVIWVKEENVNRALLLGIIPPQDQGEVFDLNDLTSLPLECWVGLND